MKAALRLYDCLVVFAGSLLLLGPLCHSGGAFLLGVWKAVAARVPAERGRHQFSH